MPLVIMRHGQAEPAAPSDAQRELTDKGRHDVVDVAKRLLPILDGQLSPEVSPSIFHSPFVRTTQTAELLYKTLVGDERFTSLVSPVAQGDLLGSNSVEGVVSWAETRSDPTVILVSHQPLVSALVAWLVEGARPSEAHRYPEFSMSPASAAVLGGDILERGQMNLEHIFHC